MSLDFSLFTPPEPAKPPCPTCGHAGPSFEPGEVYWRNATHNLSPMWRQAGIRDALYESEGQTAGSILPTLRLGLAKMVASPAEYKALNPKNGWGSYEGALDFLRTVIAACEANPDAIIEVSA